MQNKPLNPSMTTLPELLEKRNQSGRYDELIAKAKKGCYHDYKFDVVDPDCEFPCPKILLMEDLMRFPELHDVMKMVADGAFDDKADEEDVARMKEEFKDLDPGLKKIIGL
jgi:hypothetical protein